MTDDERLVDPCAAALALPAGNLVVVRAREDARRMELVRALMKIARARGLKLVVAADPALAARANADGIHVPENCIGEAAHWRVRRPDWLITCATHSSRACARAAAAGADAALLAPVFATKSHPGGAFLGLFRATAVARASALPVYALGGIDARRASRLPVGPFAGIAAVQALSATR